MKEAVVEEKDLLKQIFLLVDFFPSLSQEEAEAEEVHLICVKNRRMMPKTF